MKKFGYLSLLTAVLILCSSVLSSCGGLHKVVYDNGYYIDRTNGIKYICAPVSYEPTAVGEEYAKCGDTVLYTIPDTDPKLWITEQYEGIGGLYYAEGVVFPSLSNFEADSIIVCSSEVLTIGIGVIEDADVIAQVVDAMDSGEEAVPAETSARYFLKFASSKYPWMYYSVVYIAGADGSHYLYDRDTKRTIEIGSVISDILPDA